MTPSLDNGRLPRSPIALVVSDIDGTLIAPDKTLTTQAIAAVQALGRAGIGFTLVSSRPPRGMAALVEAVDLKVPFAAFNGASIIGPDRRTIRALHIPTAATRQTLALFEARRVAAWVFAKDAWFLRNGAGVNVARERRTVGFDPTVVETFDAVIDQADKIVGVSDDPDHLAQVELELQRALGGAANAVRSQTYYLDVTHAHADKGNAVRDLCAEIGVDLAQTAVIGDAANDVAMFKVAGFSVAMGQAAEEVKAQAAAVTGANSEEGFASALTDLILRPGKGA